MDDALKEGESASDPDVCGKGSGGVRAGMVVAAFVAVVACLVFAAIMVFGVQGKSDSQVTGQESASKRDSSSDTALSGGQQATSTNTVNASGDGAGDASSSNTSDGQAASSGNGADAGSSSSGSSSVSGSGSGSSAGSQSQGGQSQATGSQPGSSQLNGGDVIVLPEVEFD